MPAADLHVTPFCFTQVHEPFDPTPTLRPAQASIGPHEDQDDMKGPRDYAAGTRAALIALSKGTCYFPDCHAPILEYIEGEPFVTYQIAHIRDANPGNRYEPDMTDDERRGFANLILLCKPHHTLIDKTHPERFTVRDLEQWKTEREGPGMEALQGLRGLTETKLEELIVAAVSGTASVEGEAVVRVARSVAGFAARVRELRRRVERDVALWQRTWQTTRGSVIAWDPKSGERIYAEPPPVETQRHRRAVGIALAEAGDAAAPLVERVKSELAGLRAASVLLRPWADAVLRVTADVCDAAGRWPEPPPFEDDPTLERCLDALTHAVDELTARWRGEEVSEPVAPEPPPEPVEAHEARQLREHRELLDCAMRYARVDALPYDGALAGRLLHAMPFAATLPPVPTLWPYGLDATAGLIAAVARNADDAAFADLLERCLDGPLLTGVYVARHLASLAKRIGDEPRETQGVETARVLLGRVDWSDLDVWNAIEVYGRDVLMIARRPDLRRSD